MTRPTPPEHPDGITPDAWLREALRHAPDVDAAAPAVVRETILRQARAAVQPAVPVAQGNRWRRWIDGWLRPTRLGYSGAFVVLLVVGVWGLDGLDEQARAPLPPAPARPEAVVADAAPAVLAPAAVRPASDAPTQAVAPASAKPLPRAPAPPVADRAPAAARAANDAATTATRESASRDTAAAAVQPAPAPAPASPAPAAALPVVVEGTAKAATVEAAAVMPAASPKASPPGPANARLAATQDRAAAAALDPLASVLQRAAEDASVRWSVGSREGSVGAAQRAWLDALRAATAGQWTRANAAAISPAVQLSSNAGPLASLGIEAPGTLWLVVGTSVYRAPLSADASARFEEARSGW